MQKIDNDTYIVGGNSVVSFSGAAKGASAEPHSVAKINASATDSNNWCNWGDDNQYPKRLMEKVAMVGAALGGLEVLTSAHYGLGLKVFELVETEGDAEFKEKIPTMNEVFIAAVKGI